MRNSFVLIRQIQIPEKSFKPCCLMVVGNVCIFGDGVDGSVSTALVNTVFFFGQFLFYFINCGRLRLGAYIFDRLPVQVSN